MYYDDEFIMGYEVSTETELIDEDGHNLQYRLAKIQEVGVGAYCIYWGSSLASQDGTVPAGIGICSCTAETAAVHKAMEVVLERQEQGWRGAVRVVTDSKSLVDCIQSPLRRQPSTVQRLCCLLRVVTERSFLQIVWVPAHCGLLNNEKVDQLAKEGLGTHVEDQCSVPLSFEDTKARIKAGAKSRKAIVSENDVYEEGLAIREAETALAQIYVGHTTKLHPVSTYLNDNVSLCRCLSGRTTVKNDVNHYILRCSPSANYLGATVYLGQKNGRE